jgi:hypothetical protein
MTSELFTPEIRDTIETTVVSLLNDNQLMNYNTVNSSRASLTYQPYPQSLASLIYQPARPDDSQPPTGGFILHFPTAQNRCHPSFLYLLTKLTA